MYYVETRLQRQSFFNSTAVDLQNSIHSGQPKKPRGGHSRVLFASVRSTLLGLVFNDYVVFYIVIQMPAL